MLRVLAVDLGGTKTAVGVVDSDGRVLAKESFPTPLGEPKTVVDLVARLARQVIAREGPVEAAGMTLPGIADRSSGTLVRSPSSGWKDVPFARLVGDAIGLRVRSDNDVNACARAEALFGAGRGLGCFFWMTVSTGIGGAVAVEGRVLEGARGMAGEIGHLVVRPGGAACGCGNRGCLEAEAAGPAWRRKALALLDSLAPGVGGRLASLPRESIDARAVADGARAGDELCLRVVRDVGGALARGVAAIASVLDPDAIVVGGGVAAALDLLSPIVDEELRALALPDPGRPAALRPSALGYDAALVGAAALALRPY